MNVVAKEAFVGQQLSRTFKFETQLIIQVIGGGFVCIARDQTGAQNGISNNFNANGGIADGFVVGQGSTGPPNAQPFIFNWQGELWYAADTHGFQFALVICTETSQRN